ncbi:MAG: hypothetical protein AB1705_01530 [Verrucomicrobiota bacterium]
MRRPQSIAAAVAAIALSVISIAALLPDEPKYAGRTISEWVDELPSAAPTMGIEGFSFSERPWPDQTEQSTARATQAIQTLGTNAVPALIDCLREETRTSRFRRTMTPKVSWLPRPEYPSARMFKAMAGLRALGPDAAPAIRELLKDSERPPANPDLTIWLLRDCSRHDTPGFEQFLEELARSSPPRVQAAARNLLVQVKRGNTALWR